MFDENELKQIDQLVRQRGNVYNGLRAIVADTARYNSLFHKLFVDNDKVHNAQAKAQLEFAKVFAMYGDLYQERGY